MMIWMPFLLTLGRLIRYYDSFLLWFLYLTISLSGYYNSSSSAIFKLAAVPSKSSLQSRDAKWRCYSLLLRLLSKSSFLGQSFGYGLSKVAVFLVYLVDSDPYLAKLTRLRLMECFPVDIVFLPRDCYSIDVLLISRKLFFEVKGTSV